MNVQLLNLYVFCGKMKNVLVQYIKEFNLKFPKTKFSIYNYTIFTYCTTSAFYISVIINSTRFKMILSSHKGIELEKFIVSVQRM